ncbi:MAG: ABC transporter ATP-binding protein [Firmicutes bacterium]|nr:ABC transporter ATP-binding protein [Bacillota bacterium]
MKTKQLFARFLPYFKKYKWLVALDLLCASLTIVCEIVLPLIVSFITDTGANNLEALTVSLILRLGALYLLLRIINTAATYFMTSVGHIVGARIETDMRRDLFNHLNKLSFSFFNNTKVGQIMARITSDLFEITEFAHHCPEEFLIAFLKFVISFIILAGMNFWLTVIIFITVPLMAWAANRFNRKMQSGWRVTRNQIGEVNAQVEDSLLGMRVVKSFANEQVEEAKFDQGNERILSVRRKIYKAMGGMTATVQVFDGLMYLLVLVVGSLFMINGQVTPGELVAYLLYANMLLASIRRIVEFAEQFQRGMTGIERFCELMDAPVEIADAPGAIELSGVLGDIKFDHVGFSYPDDSTTKVLSDIVLHVRPGEHVALVGPSGAGKTTLTNLIPRFYEVDRGRILIDDHDIREVTLHSLRSNIGIVQQDVYLFTGSVADNIEYGKPGASRQEIIAAAKQANAHDFIMELPEGYDTYIGERGVRLSGGQKQRLSIARVFLKNPPVIILDEATSALDNESERVVQSSLEKLAAGRTTFTIAHRLTTVQNATIIWVLTKDGIVEEGSHEELLAKKGLYYHLYYA